MWLLAWAGALAFACLGPHPALSLTVRPAQNWLSWVLDSPSCCTHAEGFVLPTDSDATGTGSSGGQRAAWLGTSRCIPHLRPPIQSCWAAPLSPQLTAHPRPWSGSSWLLCLSRETILGSMAQYECQKQPLVDWAQQLLALIKKKEKPNNYRSVTARSAAWSQGRAPSSVPPLTPWDAAGGWRYSESTHVHLIPLHTSCVRDHSVHAANRAGSLLQRLRVAVRADKSMGTPPGCQHRV